MLDALTSWDADAAVLRSPLAARFQAAGATLERRGAWLVPVAVPGEERHLERVAFADASSIGKLELRGGEAPAQAADRHVIEVAPRRWIVLCPSGAQATLLAELDRDRRLALDMTGAWVVMAIAGPQSERLLRRLGPIAAVPGAGTIAGVPGRVLRRGALLWVLAAVECAQHLHDVCADLCRPLGGGPAGVDALARAVADPLLGPATVDMLS